MVFTFSEKMHTLKTPVCAKSLPLSSLTFGSFRELFGEHHLSPTTQIIGDPRKVSHAYVSHLSLPSIRSIYHGFQEKGEIYGSSLALCRGLVFVNRLKAAVLLSSL
jgi:hypothetical protein